MYWGLPLALGKAADLFQKIDNQIDCHEGTRGQREKLEVGCRDIAAKHGHRLFLHEAKRSCAQATNRVGRSKIVILCSAAVFLKR